jgi:hypothetical protein
MKTDTAMDAEKDAYMNMDMGADMDMCIDDYRSGRIWPKYPRN